MSGWKDRWKIAADTIAMVAIELLLPPLEGDLEGNDDEARSSVVQGLHAHEERTADPLRILPPQGRTERPGT